MSKIARNPVLIPDGVSVELNGQDVKVKGPKGELSNTVHSDVAVMVEDTDQGKQIVVSPKSKSREARALWGTWRSHLNNMVVGVSQGFEKVLELQGVGYRANLQGQNLVLQLGFSHDVNYAVPQGVQVAVEKQTRVILSGIDKQLVGQVAANIKSYRPPEPYKGKGIRYEGEYIMRKEGKKK
jgi:large subunit ribosomal protein L6